MAKTAKTDSAAKLVYNTLCIDDGSGDIKLVKYKGGQLVYEKYPSIVYDSKLTAALEGSDLCWECNGKPYTVSNTDSTDNKSVSQTTNNDYQFSDESAVLTNHAIYQSLAKRNDLGVIEHCNTNPIILAVTLPAKKYYNENNEIDHTVIKAKQANLLKNEVINSSTEYQANIKLVKVFSECVTAWYSCQRPNDKDLTYVHPDLVNNQNGSLIIDIGHYTVDSAVFRSGNNVSEVSTVNNIGIAHFAEMLIPEIHNFHTRLTDGNTEDPIIAQFVKGKDSDTLARCIKQLNRRIPVRLTQRQAIEIAKNGGIRVNSKETIDLSMVIAPVRALYAQKIFEYIEKHHKRFYDLDRVIVVGGGANALDKELGALLEEENDELGYHIPENPEFAVARGIFIVMNSGNNPVSLRKQLVDAIEAEKAAVVA